MGAMFSWQSITSLQKRHLCLLCCTAHPSNGLSIKGSHCLVTELYLQNDLEIVLHAYLTRWLYGQITAKKKKQLQPASMIVFTPAYDFCFQRVQSSRSAHSHRSVRLCWGKILLNEISSSRNIIKWTFANLQHYKQEYARLRQQIINLQNSSRFSFNMTLSCVS